MGILRIIRQILLRGGQPRCFIRMLVELQFYTFHTDPVLRGGPSPATAPQVRWNSILGWIIQTSLCCSSQIKIKEIFYACKWKGCMYKSLSKWKMQWKSLKTNTEFSKSLKVKWRGFQSINVNLRKIWLDDTFIPIWDYWTELYICPTAPQPADLN